MSPSIPTQPSSSSSNASRETILRNVALGALFVCPVIILIPPRKLDTYTLALLAGTFWGGNQVSKEYTGVSMVGRFQERLKEMGSTLPPKAAEMQRRIKEAKEAKAREEVRLPKEENARVLEEVGRSRGVTSDSRQEGLGGVLQKVWLGGEGKDWKRKRDEREKEALEEGKGYGDLIMDQIWEVWNWGKDKTAEAKEIDGQATKEGRSAK